MSAPPDRFDLPIALRELFPGAHCHRIKTLYKKIDLLCAGSNVAHAREQPLAFTTKASLCHILLRKAQHYDGRPTSGTRRPSRQNIVFVCDYRKGVSPLRQSTAPMTDRTSGPSVSLRCRASSCANPSRHQIFHTPGNPKTRCLWTSYAHTRWRS